MGHARNVVIAHTCDSLIAVGGRYGTLSEIALEEILDERRPTRSAITLSIMSDLARARIRITGYVQGVGFRYFARKAATGLGLRGYVRNRGDGSVEVVAEGGGSAVTALIDQLRAGPRYASIDNVDVAWEEPRGDFAGFDYSF